MRRGSKEIADLIVSEKVKWAKGLRDEAESLIADAGKYSGFFDHDVDDTQRVDVLIRLMSNTAESSMKKALKDILFTPEKLKALRSSKEAFCNCVFQVQSRPFEKPN